MALGSTVTVKMQSPPSDDWRKSSENNNYENLIASSSIVPYQDEGISEVLGYALQSSTEVIPKN